MFHSEGIKIKVYFRNCHSCFILIHYKCINIKPSYPNRLLFIILISYVIVCKINSDNITISNFVISVDHIPEKKEKLLHH